MQKTTTFLMFIGRAEEAINFYTSLFENSEIKSITRYGKEEPSREGEVIHAIFTLAGQEYMAIDSEDVHAFTFTPSMSIYVQCESEDEFDRLYTALSAGGEVLMPVDDYGFSKKFAWINDRFGVSWQFNLAA